MLVYLRWKTPKSLNPKYRDHDANLSRWHVAACDVTTGQWRTACGLDPRAGHRFDLAATDLVGGPAPGVMAPSDGAAVCGRCLLTRANLLFPAFMNNLRMVNGYQKDGDRWRPGPVQDPGGLPVLPADDNGIRDGVAAG